MQNDPMRCGRLLSYEIKRLRRSLHKHSGVDDLTSSYALLCGMQCGYMLVAGRKHAGASSLMKDIYARIAALDQGAADRAEAHSENNFAVVRKMLKTTGTIPTKTRTPRRSLR